VSIVIPSYNQAAYLEDTLRSALAQDYPAVELLVIDGGSNDGSVEIIHKYADRLAGWISEPDAGQADGINKGLRRANGAIVAWLNSDDVYLPEAVRRGAAALQADPALGFVFGDALTIDGDGRPLSRLVFDDWGLPELAGFRIICQPAVFMRRGVLEQAGLLDTNYHTMLDHHLWLRLAGLAPIKYIGGGPGGEFRPLAAARHHPAAKNVARPEQFADETLRLLQWVETHPQTAEFARHNPRRVRGGAYRLMARYLLDGGKPGEALRWYGRALAANPAYAARHAHRMVYASACLVGLGAALDRLRTPAVHTARLALAAYLDATHPELADWPGIDLKFPPGAEARSLAHEPRAHG